LAQGAQLALLGVICDAEAVAAAVAAGVGAELLIAIGGKAGPLGGPPLEALWKVEALGDGAFTGTGPFYLGCRMQLGPMVRLSCGGVHVILSSRRQQAADQEMFRHLGVEPADWRIICLKSSVHFRADFGSLADEILIVAAEGENTADPTLLRYRNLRRGVRIAPMGEAFERA
jgi:microcystin degradation protein MlrC